MSGPASVHVNALDPSESAEDARVPLSDVHKAGLVVAATLTASLFAVVPVPAPVFVVVVPEPEPPLAPSEPFDDVGLMVADPCAEDRCTDARSVFVDYEALGIEGMRGGEWITYDYAEVVRPVTARELEQEPEISLAVRLIISESGADRMLMSRQSLLEAIGILYTVDNRLDRTIYDVENQPWAPSFPGCGPGGTFYSCANAQQYLGMATWRALAPERHYDPDVLAAAVDLAVTAWWLEEHRFVPDLTEGATNYVHRCGGAAYGMSTPHCDGHMGTPQGDVRGANPFTGPIVFKGPTVWYRAMGVYGIGETHRFEYDPWFDLGLVPDPSDALADADTGQVSSRTDVALRYALVPRPPRFDVDPTAADAAGLDAIDAFGPPGDPNALEHLASWTAYGRW
jgi:hypothetical protein